MEIYLSIPIFNDYNFWKPFNPYLHGCLKTPLLIQIKIQFLGLMIQSVLGSIALLVAKVHISVIGVDCSAEFFKMEPTAYKPCSVTLLSCILGPDLSCFLIIWRVHPGVAQGLFSDLQSGITTSRLREPYGITRIEPVSSVHTESTLLTILSLTAVNNF